MDRYLVRVSVYDQFTDPSCADAVYHISSSRADADAVIRFLQVVKEGIATVVRTRDEHTSAM